MFLPNIRPTPGWAPPLPRERENISFSVSHFVALRHYRVVRAWTTLWSLCVRVPHGRCHVVISSPFSSIKRMLHSAAAQTRHPIDWGFCKLCSLPCPVSCYARSEWRDIRGWSIIARCTTAFTVLSASLLLILVPPLYDLSWGRATSVHRSCVSLEPHWEAHFHGIDKGRMFNTNCTSYVNIYDFQ